jgi:hypothetical protein
VGQLAFGSWRRARVAALKQLPHYEVLPLIKSRIPLIITYYQGEFFHDFAQSVRTCQLQIVVRKDQTGQRIKSVCRKPAAENCTMENITAIRDPLEGRASLEQMPLEILNHIFVLTCSEDLDLSLLHVSRAMTWKLFDHPVSKTVRAFWPADQQTLDLRSMATSSLPLPPGHAPSRVSVCNSDKRKHVRKEVLASAWCTPSFIRSMQVAFVRRMVKEYWDPFLERDGLDKCETSHPQFWDTLDRLAQEELPTEGNDMEICLTDNEIRYSWTKIRIWPWQGRIVIRDQLLNRSFEKRLPFLQCILVDTKSSERQGSAGFAL